MLVLCPLCWHVQILRKFPPHGAKRKGAFAECAYGVGLVGRFRESFLFFGLSASPAG